MTLRRWVFAGLCVVLVLYVVMGVVLFQRDRAGYGSALMAAAVINVGGYVWDWGRKRRRPAPVADDRAARDGYR